mgnify:FL=1
MIVRLFVLLLLAAAPLFARDAAENARIEALIGKIEALEGAKFVRNGKAHDAAEAADHLRMKLKRAGDRVKTAEDFIDGIATKSSVTGRPYRIRFKDGSETETGPWLHDRLNEIDEES